MVSPWIEQVGQDVGEAILVWPDVVEHREGICVAQVMQPDLFPCEVKLRAKGIVGRGKLQNPRFLHVTVSDRTKTVEEFAAGFAKAAPGRVGIDFFKDARERPATA